MVPNIHIFYFILKFLGDDFSLKPDHIHKTLTASKPIAVVHGDEVVIIDDRESGEGTESFILEINNATLVLKPEYLSLLPSSVMETSVLLHWNLSKVEVVIEDNDG